MRIALIVFSCVLALAALGSANAKLRKSPVVIEGMILVGVRPQQIPLLALLEIAGGVGVDGFLSSMLGRLAAFGLVVYFTGAVVAHLRINDDVKTLAPATSLLAVLIAIFALRVWR